MSYEITAPAYGALATAMLAGVKEHVRIDFADDDESVRRYIRWSLAYVENELGFRIAGGTAIWSPVLISGVSQYPVPVHPVSAFTVAAGGTDVSAEYELKKISPLTAPVLSHKDGTDFQADAVATLTVGYATPDDMPPNVEAAIYRIAGTLYENRESLTSLNIETLPLWIRDLLSGAWIPRA